MFSPTSLFLLYSQHLIVPSTHFLISHPSKLLL
nr:MAG TPA: hypothetical protein [Caudoviricetes sp.]